MLPIADVAGYPQASRQHFIIHTDEGMVYFGLAPLVSEKAFAYRYAPALSMENRKLTYWCMDALFANP